MADGDRIGKLSPRWSNVCRKMSEGYFPNLSLADGVLEVVKSDIQRYGISPIILIEEAGIRLDGIRHNYVSTHNYVDEDAFIRNLASKYIYQYPDNKNKWGIEMAIRAYKALCHKLRYGQNIIGASYGLLVEQYAKEIYNHNYVGKVQIMTDRDRAERTIQKISEIQGFVDDGIVSIATQIVEKGNINNLRMHSLAPKLSVTIATEIPCL
jgi:hypothetical protein